MPRPFCSVSFPTLRTSPVPKHVRVIRAAGSHELLVMRFRDRDLSAANYRSDVPLHVSWGFFPHQREDFVGYIHHSRPTVEHSGTLPEIEVVAVGPTRVLRNEVPKNWGATRADIVVSQLATANRLAHDVDASPVVRKNLMQPAESGWEFLRDLAEADGYFLAASGILIHFWDLDKRLPKLRPHAPVFTRKNTARFRPLDGETNPTDREASSGTAYALDLAGKGSAYSTSFATGTSSLDAALKPGTHFSRVAAGAVLTDARDAKMHLESEARRNKRMFQAEADVTPFPPLRPGDPVVFHDYGARHSGYWMVDRVEFELSGEKITSKVSVSRAEARDDGRRPALPATRSPHRKRPTARLVAGAWVA